MIPAESTATSVTRASPIISADAVEAVRCGFRLEFSRARLPTAPARRVAGHPRNSTSAGTNRAESSATPMNNSTAPRPISASVPLVP